ncbi:MAG: DUF1987 domain-containing protein [Bacteroidales bacterium]|nr:DUF1987 domain-containing protein [Tenuifilaceae bacterium]
MSNLPPLRIPDTPTSPEIILDKEQNRLEFYGKSLPEDSNEFYSPIISWLKEYVVSPNRETVVLFKLDYFNSSTSKKLLDIFYVLNEIHRQKKVILIHWYYRSDDDDMRESGETFSELVPIPFKLTPY